MEHKTPRILKRVSSRYILNMLPIYRIRDGIKALGNNEQVFSQCAELFDKGESVMIFPEGNHGEHYYLRPLTKGTSRIALEALSNGNSDLKIVPCGLNFFAHRKARTKVIIAYGKPIAVKKFQKTYKEDKQAGLKALTAALSDEMKECLIIPEPTPDYEMKAKHVFNPKNEGMDFQKLRELASKDYSKNANQIIEQPPPNSFVLWLTSLPNWGPHWMLIKIIKPFKDKVFWTSMKFSCMIIIMPVWWGLSFVVGYFLIGFWGGMSLVFLSILGLFVRAELLK